MKYFLGDGVNEYDTIAWFYNKYWTEEAPDLFEKVLNRLLLPYIPTKGSILDLCCGTGQVCARLRQRLFDVTGLDLSANMLAHAKKNAPGVEFVLEDASDFSLVKKFDCVISLFDSINHILEYEKLVSTFKCVKKCLKSDGIFLFDVNSSDAFDENWLAGFCTVDEESACMLRPGYDNKKEVAIYNITGFAKEEECWKRFDSQVFEKYYSNETLIKALKEANFSTIQILEGELDLDIEAFAGRNFFLTR